MLVPTAPFHFDGTAYNPSHFPTDDARWRPGTLWQTFRWGRRTYGLRLRDAGRPGRPAVELTVYGARPLSRSALDEIAAEVRWRFDLDSAGVPEFVRRFRRDPYVGTAIRRRPGMRDTSAASLYEYLVISVLLQNTAVRRTISWLGDLIRL